MGAVEDLLDKAQRAAEKHLADCNEWLWWSEGEREGQPEPDCPACGPFCGCDTCIVREVLFASWQTLEEAHRLELLNGDG